MADECEAISKSRRDHWLNRDSVINSKEMVSYNQYMSDLILLINGWMNVMNDRGIKIFSSEMLETITHEVFIEI